MSIMDNLTCILDELKRHSKRIDNWQLERYTDEIGKAKKIYATGTGRSGLAIRAFAMRLMHLGKEVYILGDVTAPSAKSGDLLLIGSGSGETKSLVTAAEKAKNIGMRIALNTINSASTLARLADIVIVLPGASQKVQNDLERTASIQPMGSSYEQLSLLVYDAIVMTLMEKLGQTNDEMFTRHANIE